jgi:2-phosphoglycerate kinase
MAAGKLLTILKSKKTMKVVNLFGPPGVGKSVISAGIYSDLAKNNLNVELCQEYAKQLVYEQRTDLLKVDQLYILAKQNRKLYTLENQNLDYVVIDSPLFLQLIYNNPNNLSQSIFEPLVLELFNKYDNINFFLERGKEYAYQTEGRIHSLEESNEIGGRIKDKLKEYQIPYYSLKSNNRTINKIVSKIYELRMNQDF